MILRIIIVIALLGLLAACNKTVQEAQTDSSSTTAATAAAPDGAATDGVAPADAAAPASQAGSTLALADGSSVTVVKASVVDTKPADHSGLIAVEGSVKAVYADKGVFLITDLKDADCAPSEECACCPANTIPIKLALENYEGGLPSPEQAVLVVGELTATESGYTIDVREVRSGDTVLLSLKQDLPPASEAVPPASV